MTAAPDPVEPVATPHDGETPGPSERPPVDRFHNQENPSPEAIGALLRDIQTTLAALDARVEAVATGLSSRVEGAERRADAGTRRLALEVAGLGEALARRVKAVEGLIEVPPPPPAVATSGSTHSPPRRPRALVGGLVLAAVLAAILGGLWWLQRSEASHPAPAAAPARLPTPATVPAPALDDSSAAPVETPSPPAQADRPPPRPVFHPAHRHPPRIARPAPDPSPAIQGGAAAVGSDADRTGPAARREPP